MNTDKNIDRLELDLMKQAAKSYAKAISYADLAYRLVEYETSAIDEGCRCTYDIESSEYVYNSYYDDDDLFFEIMTDIGFATGFICALLMAIAAIL